METGDAILAAFAEELGIAAEMRELVEAAPPGRFKDAAAAELDGDVERAASIFADIGCPTGEATWRLRAGRSLIEAGRRAEGEAELQKSLAFHRSVNATFFVELSEQLLANTA